MEEAGANVPAWLINRAQHRMAGTDFQDEPFFRPLLRRSRQHPLNLVVALPLRAYNPLCTNSLCPNNTAVGNQALVCVDSFWFC